MRRLHDFHIATPAHHPSREKVARKFRFRVPWWHVDYQALERTISHRLQFFRYNLMVSSGNEPRPNKLYKINKTHLRFFNRSQLAGPLHQRSQPLEFILWNSVDIHESMSTLIWNFLK